MASHVNISKMLTSLKQEYLPKALNIIRMAMYEYASAVLTDSKEICPVSTLPTRGTLLASGSVSEVEDLGGKLRVTIGYNSQYAVYVHEILTNFHTPPTKAKYLEIPMRERASGFIPYVAKKLEEAFA